MRFDVVVVLMKLYWYCDLKMERSGQMGLLVNKEPPEETGYKKLALGPTGQMFILSHGNLHSAHQIHQIGGSCPFPTQT